MLPLLGRVRRRRQSALPSVLPGLVAWGEGSSLGADGSSIPSWPNLTLSGLDPAQGTGANQPTVAADAINGQKAALFTSASSQYLQFSGAALNWFQNIPGATLAVVIQPVTVPATQVNILSVGINASATARLAIFKRAATNLYSVTIRTDDSTAVIVDTTTVAVVGTPVILTASFDALNGPIAVAVNGAVMGSGTASPLQNLQNTATHDVTLGASGTPGNYFNGYVPAYAMWNVGYSRADLRGVLLRWSTLYGITLTG